LYYRLTSHFLLPLSRLYEDQQPETRSSERSCATLLGEESRRRDEDSGPPGEVAIVGSRASTEWNHRVVG